MGEVKLTEENSLEALVADFSQDIELTPQVIKHRRARICELEKSLKTIPHSVGMEEFNKGRINHHFGTGVYGRELFLPAGTVCVSKIHKGETFNVIAQGLVSVISEEGFRTIEGPYCFVSKPYTKRAVIAHTDTLWVTSHGCDETDLDKVEEHIIAKDFKDIQIEGV